MTSGEHITCPYCGERSDYDGDIYRTVPVDCESCGKTMHVWIHETVTYDCQTEEEWDEYWAEHDARVKKMKEAE